MPTPVQQRFLTALEQKKQEELLKNISGGAATEDPNTGFGVPETPPEFEGYSPEAAQARIGYSSQAAASDTKPFRYAPYATQNWFDTPWKTPLYAPYGRPEVNLTGADQQAQLADLNKQWTDMGFPPPDYSTEGTESWRYKTGGQTPPDQQNPFIVNQGASATKIYKYLVSGAFGDYSGEKPTAEDWLQLFNIPHDINKPTVNADGSISPPEKYKPLIPDSYFGHDDPLSILKEDGTLVHANNLAEFELLVRNEAAGLGHLNYQNIDNRPRLTSIADMLDMEQGKLKFDKEPISLEDAAKKTWGELWQGGTINDALYYKHKDKKLTGTSIKSLLKTEGTPDRKTAVKAMEEYYKAGVIKLEQYARYKDKLATIERIDAETDGALSRPETALGLAPVNHTMTVAEYLAEGVALQKYNTPEMESLTQLIGLQSNLTSIRTDIPKRREELQLSIDKYQDELDELEKTPEILRNPKAKADIVAKQAQLTKAQNTLKAIEGVKSIESLYDAEDIKNKIEAQVKKVRAERQKMMPAGVSGDLITSIDIGGTTYTPQEVTQNPQIVLDLMSEADKKKLRDWALANPDEFVDYYGFAKYNPVAKAIFSVAVPETNLIEAQKPLSDKEKRPWEYEEKKQPNIFQEGFNQLLSGENPFLMGGAWSLTPQGFNTPMSDVVLGLSGMAGIAPAAQTVRASALVGENLLRGLPIGEKGVEVVTKIFRTLASTWVDTSAVGNTYFDDVLAKLGTLIRKGKVKPEEAVESVVDASLRSGTPPEEVVKALEEVPGVTPDDAAKIVEEIRSPSEVVKPRTKVFKPGEPTTPDAVIQPDGTVTATEEVGYKKWKPGDPAPEQGKSFVQDGATYVEKPATSPVEAQTTSKPISNLMGVQNEINDAIKSGLANNEAVNSVLTKHNLPEESKGYFRRLYGVEPFLSEAQAAQKVGGAVKPTATTVEGKGGTVPLGEGAKVIEQGATVESKSKTLKMLNDRLEAYAVDTSYSPLSSKESRAIASDFVVNKPKEARASLWDKRLIPKGTTEIDVKTAYTLQQLEAGNYEAASLATISRKFANIEAGRNVQANKGWINDNSMLSWVDKAQDAKMSAKTKGVKPSELKAQLDKDAGTLATEIKAKSQVKLDEFKQMIDDLICKD